MTFYPERSLRRATQFPPPATSYPLSLHSLADSWWPREKSSPLKSSKSNLLAAIEGLLFTPSLEGLAQLAQSLEGNAFCEGRKTPQQLPLESTLAKVCENK